MNVYRAKLSNHGAKSGNSMSVSQLSGVPISTIPNRTADRRQVSLDLLFTASP